MIKSAILIFAVILGGALLSSILGGLFAMATAWISPEFVDSLFSAEEGVNVVRYAFSVGMIWGLFIGAAVSGFACGLAVLLRILKLWIKVD
jgi:ABC-type multidrug transport system fused ATPase/permease subunit